MKNGRGKGRWTSKIVSRDLIAWGEAGEKVRGRVRERGGNWCFSGRIGREADGVAHKRSFQEIKGGAETRETGISGDW